MNAAHIHLSGGMRRVIRDEETRHNVIVLLLLFVGAFLSVLFFCRDDAAVDNADISESPQPATAPAYVPTQTVLAAPVVPVRHYEPARVSATIDMLATNVEAVPASQDAHQLPAEVSGAADADVRGVAIRELNDVATPEALAALAQIVRSDEVARNRILAVNSLRLMGKRGDTSGRVQALLREAMADADANVATNARDAFQEITH
jgi:hypothetical protein